jgi:DNA polymerase III subunit epsilon
MKAVVLDFETADSSRYSPCEIGLTWIDGAEISGTESYFIKPPCYPKFSSFNQMLHGITPEQVVNSPNWDELWPTLWPRIQNRVVFAHSASFDTSVIRATHRHYQLPDVEFDYYCTITLAKKYWPGLSGYGLTALAHHKGYNPGGHRAGADSNVTAQLLLDLCKDFGPDPLKKFCEDGLPPKVFSLEGSKVKSIDWIRKVYPDIASRFVEATYSIDGLTGKHICFTGQMNASRSEMENLAFNVGAIPQSGVSAATDILVVGQQDIRFVGQDGMSSKQEKAEKMRSKGHHIEVMAEVDFLRML